MTQADLFFAEGRVAVVSCDEEGIIRMYEYDPRSASYFASCGDPANFSPADPESKGGQRLLCQTEFHGQVEYRTSYVIARRPKNSDSGTDVPQAKLICGRQKDSCPQRNDNIH